MEMDAVVAGHVCLDINPSFAQENRADPMKIFAPGRLNIVGPAVLSTGGAVSNTGLAMARMGFRMRLIGKVGDDGFGDLIRARFAEEGASDGMRVSPGEASSYSVVLAVPGVDRIFFHCPGCNDTFTPEDVDSSSFGGARLLHFGYPPLMRQFYADGGENLRRLFAAVRAAGTATSLDMAYPDPASASGRADWRGILTKALPLTDLFVPSVEEVLIMLDPAGYEARRREFAGRDLAEALPMDDIRRLADALLDMGCGLVLMKCGVRGLYLRSGPAQRLRAIPRLGLDAAAWASRELWQVPFSATVVNATGSGDCAIAGFLGAILRNEPPETALRIAAAAGWRNVQTPDTLSGMGPYDALRIDALRLTDVLPARLGTGWTALPEAGLHVGARDRK